jgi:hypothetical protein
MSTHGGEFVRICEGDFVRVCEGDFVRVCEGDFVRRGLCPYTFFVSWLTQLFTSVPKIKKNKKTTNDDRNVSQICFF